MGCATLTSSADRPLLLGAHAPISPKGSSLQVDDKWRHGKIQKALSPNAYLQPARPNEKQIYISA
jgi:hypothetical protein